MENLIIYTDGGARGNPGPAGAGVVFCDASGKIVKTFKKSLGERTNNQAEYEAVILALEEAVNLGVKTLKFYLDSELVVRQLNGQYKVKNQDLMPLVQKVLKLMNKFSQVTFSHIPREKNAKADKLVNQAIDEAVK
jgi:ribonuclease HI